MVVGRSPNLSSWAESKDPWQHYTGERPGAFISTLKNVKTGQRIACKDPSTAQLLREAKQLLRSG